MTIFCGVAASEDKESDKDVTVAKGKDGLYFKVPPDWPIEKRGGVVAPIPIEEYLARKFNGLEKRLQEMGQQIGSMDLRVRVLEEDAKKQRRLQAGSPS